MTPTERGEQKSSLSPSLHTATLVPPGRQPPLQDMDKGKTWLRLGRIPRLPGQMASTLGESQEDSLRGRAMYKAKLTQTWTWGKVFTLPLMSLS